MWFIENAECVKLCPNCGGKLFWGDVYNWPPDRGGDWQDCEIHCHTCGRQWDSDDLDVSDDQGILIGWSLDGYFVNGCEGPVKVIPDHEPD